MIRRGIWVKMTVAHRPSPIRLRANDIAGGLGAKKDDFVIF